MNINAFIKNIIKSETFEGFSSIQDRYINGDCESLALLLYKKDNFNGEIIKIRQERLPAVYNHYIYKKNSLFYDINGEHPSILELMKDIEYFDIELDFHIS